MQLADCLVRLGGDVGNTVPKYGVTAAELALLREIHGPDAVINILPAGEDDLDPNEERERLRATYGGAKSTTDTDRLALDVLYPGANPRLFTSLAEIGIPETCFAALERAKPDHGQPVGRRAKKSAPAGEQPVDPMA